MDQATMDNLRQIVIGTFFAYTAIMLLIGYYAKKYMDKVSVNKYMEEFYTGGRGMGSLVVAMMIAAGLCSAGTFLGGPGLGYSAGMSMVLMVSAQNFMNFIVLGEVGKKIGIVARRIGAQSIFGLLLHRFNKSRLISLFGVISIVIFMGSYVVAQIVGGARLFESMTGMSYELGLILFAGVVLAVVVLGGVKGVAIAIVFQGIVMTVAVIALTVGAIEYVSPLESTLKQLAVSDPKLMSPLNRPLAYQISMWINFGLVLVGIPHATMGALTYKDTKSMHKAIVIGGIFVVLWSLTLPYLGLLTKAVLPNLKAADHAIPFLTMLVLPPWLAGITLAGVAGAIQSTVGAMIIVIVSSLVKETYQNYFNPNASPEHLKKVNVWMTVAVCAVTFIASIQPPEALEYLIIFAVGGLASSFFWPIMLGLYWMRCNEYGAMIGMFGGLATYIVGAGNYLPITFGMHAIVVALVVSGVLTVGVSMVTPKTPRYIIEVWFGLNKSST
ncbi:MAG: sodium/pantothenate symporter [Synergistaceae bacterium]|jgi:sodium/pantothenate symporter|nr:sodium/pantothenate symporter [Synergistaceae bacterium]